MENDLDTAIRNILHRSDLDSHEKAKMYTHILQRYLTIAKQADRETNVLTLNMPTTDKKPPEQYDETTSLGDAVVEDVLKNVPQRSVKNISYILDKMVKAKYVSSWTSSGEFVYKGRTIHGSHMCDLVVYKDLSAIRDFNNRVIDSIN